MTSLLATAFAAGLVATVNPCGFAMLPAYLSYFLGLDDGGERSQTLVRAVTVSAQMSLAFLVVFGTSGALLVAGVRAIVEFIPWLAVLVGAALVFFGIATFRGRYLTVQFGSGTVNRRSVFGFGVSYAVASLSCTLPIFLSLVAGTFTSASFVGGVSAFLAYAAGMALVMTAVTLALAVGRDRIVRVIRSSARYLGKVSGAVLVAAGVFIVWYWATVLASGSVALGGNGLVRAVDRISAAITGFVADRPGWVALGLTLVIGTGVVALRRLGFRRGTRPKTPEPDSGGEASQFANP